MKNDFISVFCDGEQIAEIPIKEQLNLRVFALVADTDRESVIEFIHIDCEFIYFEFDDDGTVIPHFLSPICYESGEVIFSGS